MYVNIHFDDTIGQQLNAIAQQTGESLNAMTRKAVSEWLAHQSQPRWPEAVVNFKGIPDVPLFEASRDRLRIPADDPLV